MQIAISTLRLVFVVVLMGSMSWSAMLVGATSVEELALRQEQVSDKYARLESLMLKMSDVDASTNPRRAGLLRRAIAQANDGHIRHQLHTLIKLLNDEEYESAIENQADVRDDLKNLLELLLNENRSKRLQEEQSRLRSYIKEIERINRLQRAIQARTEGNVPAQNLQREQKNLADRTGRLNREMRENEEGTLTEQSQSPSDNTEGESLSDRDAPADKTDQHPLSKDSGSKSAEKQNEPKNSDPKAQSQDEGSKGGTQPSQAAPKPRQSRQGQEQKQSKPQEDDSAEHSDQAMPEEFAPRRRVEVARQHMQDAGDDLGENEREGAVADQDKAQEQLRKAIAELEEILRQMREEEVERMLVMLEARFRRMLEMQVIVYEATQKIDKTMPEKRNYEFEIQAGELGFEERKILTEANRALILLHEEGSSVAFTEVVNQMRDDMEQVAERLTEAKVGAITQSIEQDIITALEEMIDALKKEQKSRQEGKKLHRSGRFQPMDKTLVDMLSELKMIRSMENRVYKRTQRYARLLDNLEDPAGQATDEDLVVALRKLAKRQHRIHAITRDIVLGKNR